MKTDKIKRETLTPNGTLILKFNHIPTYIDLYIDLVYKRKFEYLKIKEMIGFRY